MSHSSKSAPSDAHGRRVGVAGDEVAATHGLTDGLSVKPHKAAASGIPNDTSVTIAWKNLDSTESSILNNSSSPREAVTKLVTIVPLQKANSQSSYQPFIR